MKNNAGVKSGHRFNLFDALIVLLLLGAIAVGWFYFSRNNVGVASNVKVTYTVEVRRVPELIKNSAQSGDAIQDAVKKNRIGSITEVTVLPDTETIMNRTDGLLVEAELPGRYKVTLNVEADGVRRDGRVYINDYPLSVGTLVYFHSKNFSGKGYCIAMELS